MEVGAARSQNGAMCAEARPLRAERDVISQLRAQQRREVLCEGLRRIRYWLRISGVQLANLRCAESRDAFEVVLRCESGKFVGVLWFYLGPI